MSFSFSQPHSNLKEKSKATNSVFIGCVIFLCFFVTQAIFFNHQFRPDEIKAIDYFRSILEITPGPLGEIFIRLSIFVSNCLIVFILYWVRLIDKKTLVLAMIWPMSAFLFSKIYWEFFVFPLCLIRLDTSRKTDLSLILSFLLLFLVTKEYNLLLLMSFRGILLGQKIGFKKSAPLGFLAACFVVSFLIENGHSLNIPFLGAELARFSWTREIANPEYSIFETIAVFLTSMHFFTLHDGYWQIDLTFSVLVILLIFQSNLVNKPNFDEVCVCLTLTCIILGFTTITHVFQNARYYFFFIPVITLFIKGKMINFLAYLGLLHVAMKCIEVSLTG